MTCQISPSLHYALHVMCCPPMYSASHGVCLSPLSPPEAMPGSIRKAEFFVSFMRRFNEYLKAGEC